MKLKTSNKSLTNTCDDDKLCVTADAYVAAIAVGDFTFLPSNISGTLLCLKEHLHCFTPTDPKFWKRIVRCCF